MVLALLCRRHGFRWNGRVGKAGIVRCASQHVHFPFCSEGRHQQKNNCTFFCRCSVAVLPFEFLWGG